MKKMLSGLMVAASVATMVWFAGSWGEVVCKNTNPNPEYSKFNMFTIFLSLTE